MLSGTRWADCWPPSVRIAGVGGESVTTLLSSSLEVVTVGSSCRSAAFATRGNTREMSVLHSHRSGGCKRAVLRTGVQLLCWHSGHVLYEKDRSPFVCMLLKAVPVYF